MIVTHIYSNQSRDEAEVWCGVENYFVQDGVCVEPTTDPAEATCPACLLSAETFGRRCADRRSSLQHERTNGQCSYAHHAADCTCNGMGGDR